MERDSASSLSSVRQVSEFHLENLLAQLLLSRKDAWSAGTCDTRIVAFIPREEHHSLALPKNLLVPLERVFC